ncbi:hypothetical protein EII34_04765 [Arachnia propionica]|uniref:Uncharacterized protein n=1 Tax=Arachnia propionica TaxID=1750 RepID=A0A3P1T9F0_9ACTN|nr:hypothetical protein [Arachnia propionica]RRD05999.1 hypothetical protein EII34_04765 [Arachnia propionica]
MDVTRPNRMIADPARLGEVTHKEHIRSSWSFAACCPATTAGGAWLALRRQEDLRWEITPGRGRITVFRVGLRGVSSTAVTTADLADLRIEEREDDHRLVLPGLTVAMHVRRADAKQLIAAYDEFRRSLPGDR